MKALLKFLLEARVQRVTRDMLKHAERHCTGEEDCPQWQAINRQYDDAWDRLKAADA